MTCRQYLQAGIIQLRNSMLKILDLAENCLAHCYTCNWGVSQQAVIEIT